MVINMVKSMVIEIITTPNIKRKIVAVYGSATIFLVFNVFHI